jgi:branched-chain amino acid transport system ATP-binding protein
MNLLDVQGLMKKYYGLVAVDRVSLSIGNGELVGLIGPNGSGKTTLFDCITKLTEPNAGRVIFGERDITGEGPHTIALAGLVRTFQQARIFPRMTLVENLLLAAQQHQLPYEWSNLWDRSGVKRSQAELLARAKEPEWVGLTPSGKRGKPFLRATKATGNGDGTDANPKLLLLDEPTAVNPVMIEKSRK